MTDTEILNSLCRHIRASYEVTNNLHSRAVLEAVHDWIKEQRAKQAPPQRSPWRKLRSLFEQRTA